MALLQMPKVSPVKKAYQERTASKAILDRQAPTVSAAYCWVQLVRLESPETTDKRAAKESR